MSRRPAISEASPPDAHAVSAATAADVNAMPARVDLPRLLLVSDAPLARHGLGIDRTLVSLFEDYPTDKFLLSTRNRTGQVDQVFRRSDFFASGLAELSDHMRQFNTVPNASGVVFSRKAAAATEMPAGFRFCGDWLFWARLFMHGDVVYVAQPLNHFRCHGGTTRAADSAAHRRQRAVESLRVMHEINERLLGGNRPATLERAYFTREWRTPTATLPWFILREPGIAWQLRVRFFFFVMAWRAWWCFESVTRWCPYRRDLFRMARRLAGYS